MSLPDIDFRNIRKHQGTQAKAFEELCSQLANDEQLPDRTSFERKGGGGDGGVECFATHADGSETGWQVKFYSDFDSMLKSLDDSLTTALDKHPAMRRFIACFHFDLADSRRDNVTTARFKWNEWRDRRVNAATTMGRTIVIDRWDAHELKQRLTDSNPRSAGRVAFWFDQAFLTQDWFRRTFERTKDSLGERYSPATHVDIPVRQTILCALRDPAVFTPLQAFASRIEEACARAPDEGYADICSAILQFAAALRRLGDQPPDPFPLTAVLAMTDTTSRLVSEWHGRVKARWGSGPGQAMTAVSDLLLWLRKTARYLREEQWNHVDARALLVLGAAGSGKSHLLADACLQQLNGGRPAIMILGGKLPDGEPWREILKDLDLPSHLQTAHFLGALNAAGEAAGVRTLVAIDALNERNGQLIWPERLPGLLQDALKFPWITLVLSCRTTYEHIVIPDSLRGARLPRIEHEGFGDDEVLYYLQRRGISVLETPTQLSDLQNPLFLRLVCDALQAKGEVLLPESLGSISDAFALLVSGLVRRIESTLGIHSRRGQVQKSIDILAGEMAVTGCGQLPFGRADELIRSIYHVEQIDRDLLFQLESEGLLAVDNDGRPSGIADMVVRFTFERLGDHAIADHLLRSSMPAGASPQCTSGSPLHLALTDPHSLIASGLLEALAVKLPEQFGVELPDLAGLPAGLALNAPFEASLLTRRRAAFTPRTWELIEQRAGCGLRFETLIALSTEPDHPFNVTVLDAELRAMRMPERDAHWSTHLASSGRAEQLVDWALYVDQDRVTRARAELTALQLCWFLTATLRPLRDRATKALVVLFADRARLAIEVWRRFKELDDAYVTERLMAALYGAAMQGRWEPEDLLAVAQEIYGLFAARTPPRNILLRDHALGLIKYALSHGGPVADFDPEVLEEPFADAAPIEDVADATIARYVRLDGDRGAQADEIVKSCLEDDFGHQMLEHVAQDWEGVKSVLDHLAEDEGLVPSEQLDAAAMRRWVANRAHELGWSESLHGEFDMQLQARPREAGLERIGKKYQWLALYELNARMSDNLRIAPGGGDPLWLRNIDPSLLAEQSRDDSMLEFPKATFWSGAVPELPARTADEAADWLRSSTDILDALECIAVHDSEAGRDWLVLQGYESWSAAPLQMRCEAARHVRSMVVRAAELDVVERLLSAGQVSVWTNLPRGEGDDYCAYLGEFPWRQFDEDNGDSIEKWRPFGSAHNLLHPVTVRPTTVTYSADSSNDDWSISDDLNLYMPARWIAKSLGLRLVDGCTAAFQDATGKPTFMDPSVSAPGRGAALIDRFAFLDLLQREGLIALWAVATHKEASFEPEGGGGGEHSSYCTWYRSEGQEIRVLFKSSRFKDPSSAG